MMTLKIAAGVLVLGWLALMATSSAVQVYGDTKTQGALPAGQYSIFGDSTGAPYLTCTYFTGTGFIQMAPRDMRFCRRIISLDDPRQ